MVFVYFECFLPNLVLNSIERESRALVECQDFRQQTFSGRLPEKRKSAHLLIAADFVGQVQIVRCISRLSPRVQNLATCRIRNIALPILMTIMWYIDFAFLLLANTFCIIHIISAYALHFLPVSLAFMWYFGHSHIHISVMHGPVIGFLPIRGNQLNTARQKQKRSEPKLKVL